MCVHARHVHLAPVRRHCSCPGLRTGVVGAPPRSVPWYGRCVLRATCLAAMTGHARGRACGDVRKATGQLCMRICQRVCVGGGRGGGGLVTAGSHRTRWV